MRKVKDKRLQVQLQSKLRFTKWVPRQYAPFVRQPHIKLCRRTHPQSMCILEMITVYRCFTEVTKYQYGFIQKKNRI